MPSYEGPATLMWRLNRHGGPTIPALLVVEETGEGWYARATVDSAEAVAMREMFADSETPFELDFPDGSSFDVLLTHQSGVAFEVTEMLELPERPSQAVVTVTP